jgi:hypothetical protein
LANKSIIQVQVDDEQFKKFLALYKNYEDGLKKTPDTWDKVGMAADKANAKLKTMMGNVGTIAKHFDGIAKSILKISAFAATGGGLGAFALDRMAGGVLNAQRSSRGLGVSIGQQSSFRVNMGRYVDPASTLSNVANARNDLSQQWAFRTAGIGAQQEATSNNFQLSLDLIQNAKKIVDSTPPQMLQQVAQARGLLNFFGMDDLRRLGAASSQEIAGASSSATRDVGAFGLDTGTANQWAKLSVQLDRAGTAIETSFIRGLTPLAPEFASLSQSVANSIESILGSNGFKTVIDDLSSGIKSLAAWMNSPDFSADLTAFGAGIKLIVQDIGAGIKFFEGIPGLNPAATPGNGKTPVPADPNSTLQNLPPAVRNALGLPPIQGDPRYQPDPAPDWGTGLTQATRPDGGYGSTNGAMSYFMNHGQSRKVAAAMSSQGQFESGFFSGADSFDPKSGRHKGMFQWSAARRAQILKGTGIDVWTDMDPDHQYAAANWELNNTYKGARNAMNAAYGPAQAGVVADNQYEQSGDTPLQQGARGALSAVNYRAVHVKLHISNPAGANVHASANAMAN